MQAGKLTHYRLTGLHPNPRGGVRLDEIAAQEKPLEEVRRVLEQAIADRQKECRQTSILANSAAELERARGEWHAGESRSACLREELSRGVSLEAEPNLAGQEGTVAQQARAAAAAWRSTGPVPRIIDAETGRVGSGGIFGFISRSRASARAHAGCFRGAARSTPPPAPP